MGCCIPWDVKLELGMNGSKSIKIPFFKVSLSEHLTPLCPVSNITKTPCPWLKEGWYRTTAFPSWVYITVCGQLHRFEHMLTPGVSGTLGSTGFTMCAARLLCKDSLCLLQVLVAMKGARVPWRGESQDCMAVSYPGKLHCFLNIDLFLNRILIHLQWEVRRQRREEMEKSGSDESSIPSKKTEGKEGARTV